MKRTLALLLVFVMAFIACGCSAKNGGKKEKPAIAKSDKCDFLINAKWEGNDSQCVNVITFKGNGDFDNWCYCGSTVGDGDLVKKYSYREADKSVLLYNDAHDNFETGKVLYVDDLYLIIKLWSKTFCYENMDLQRPKAHLEALEETGTEDLTKPYLTVLGYVDGNLKVSSHNYDKDASDNFKVWELETSQDITFKSVEVRDKNGSVTVKEKTLNNEDVKHIGEYYTSGFFEMNRDGQVQSVVFYGELIIQG